MITFNQKNKKAARVSNCCRAEFESNTDIKGMGPNDFEYLYYCKKCNRECKTVTFYEYLTEQLSNLLLGEKIPLDIVHGLSGELIIPANRKITKTLLRKVAINYNHIDIDPSPVRNRLREYIGNAAAKFGMEF